MKLNAKGQAASDKWSKLWDYEVAEQEMIAVARNDYSKVEYGWSCIEYLEKDINDEAGLLCMVYGDDVFYDLYNWNALVGFDEEWYFGVTKRDLLRLLVTEYLEMEDDFDIESVTALAS